MYVVLTLTFGGFLASEQFVNHIHYVNILSLHILGPMQTLTILDSNPYA